MTFRAIGIARHRIGSDGVGVTTLVGGHGYPLDCRYCLNPHCKRPKFTEYTVGELYEKLKPDTLYFSATGGGVTFGGGEPMLQADFIAAFVEYAKKSGADWRFTLETSLSASADVRMLVPYIDEFIVDIKDMNDEIYRAYTKKSPDNMQKNLAHLAKICPDRVRVKTPLIPGFNIAADVLHSQMALSDMGFLRIERLRYTTEIGK